MATDFDGAVGQNTRLGALTINSAGTTTADLAIDAASLSQLAGTATTLTGLVDTTGTVALTSATLNVDGGIQGDGGITLTGATATNLSSNLTTVNSGITIDHDLTLSGNAQLSTDAMGGNILLSGAVDGGNDLTLIAGSGNIDFDGAVGQNTRLGALTINSAGTTTADLAIDAASLSQLAGTATTLTGLVDTTGTVALTSATLNVDGGIQGDGGITLTGATATNLSSNLTTVNSGITIDHDLTLSGNAQLSTGVTGGNIGFNSSIAGGLNSLELDAGPTGDIVFSDTATNLSALTITNANSVTANEQLSVTGLADITALGTITVGNTTAGDFGSLNLDATTISITESDASVLADVDAITFTITSGGSITQTGPLSVSGVSTLSAASSSILLDNLANDFGTVTVTGTTTTDVTITDLDNLTIGGMDITGDLDVDAGGLVIDTGVSSVAGNASITTTGSGSSIILGQLDVAGTIGLNTAATSNASITNAVGIEFASTGSTINGNLVAIATTGDITDSGSVVVTGTTSLTTLEVNGSIDLGNLDSTGSVDVSTNGASGDVTITNAGQLVLNASTVGGALDISATTGGISDAGVLEVTGNVTLNDVAQVGVVLDTLETDGNVIVSSSGDLTIVNDTVLNLQGSITGMLDATATAGGITDSDELNVTGATTFTTASGSNIILDTSNNTFGGAVSFVASTGNLADVTIVDDTLLDLQGLTIGGNLNATGAGLTQSGVLSIGGASSFTSTGNNNDIVLTNIGNNFGTSVVAFTDATSDASLVNATSISLGTSTVNGHLSLTAPGVSVTGNVTADSLTLDATGGNLSDLGGQVTVSGNSLLTVTGANSLSLDNPLNDFGSLQITAGTGMVTVSDASDLILNGLSAGGDVLVSAGAAITDSAGTTISIVGLADITASGTITLGDDGGDTTNFGSLNIQGTNVEITEDSVTELADVDATTFTLVSGGAITQTGPLSVSGVTTLTAPGASITLDDAGNDFGTVTILGSSSTDVTIEDTDDLVLGGLDITGNLDVDAGGTLTDSNPIDVGGTASIATTGTGSDITLDDLTVSGAIDINTDATSDAILVNAIDITFSSAVTSNVNGDLSVTATTGDITDAAGATLEVSGLADVTASSGDVTLGDNVSDTTNFGSLNVEGGSVSITENSATELADVDATAFTLVSGGAITQTGPLSVSGVSTLTAPGASITLDDAGNDFGTVTILGSTSTDVTVEDTDDLILGGLDITGNLDVDAGGTLTDSNPIDVGGTASIATTGTGSDITLDDLTVSGAIDINTDATSDVILVNTVGVEFSATRTSTVNGDLTVTASSGDITDEVGATLEVDGLADLTATLGDITLGDDGTDITNFGSLNVEGGSVSITENSATELADVDATTFTLVSGGAITQTGPLSVSGVSTFTAPGASITLDDVGNDFGTVTILGSTSTDVTVEDTDDLVLGGLDITGNLDVDAGGTLTDSNPIDVGGTASIATTGTGSDITLDDLTVSGAIDINTDATSDVILVNTVGVEFSATRTSTVNGDLTVTASSGDITDEVGATLEVDGLADLTATLGDITLGDDGTDVTNFGSLTVEGDTVSITENSATELADVDATTFTLVSGGAITQTGPLSVSGVSTFTAPGASITLDDVGNDFGTVTILGSTSTDVTVEDTDDLILGGLDITGNLDVDATEVDIAAAIATGGTTTIDASVGTVDLQSTGSLASDEAISLTGSAGIVLSGDITTSGDQVDINSAVTLGDDVDIQTNSGVPAGANINFDSTIAGATFNLDLNAGNGGNILFADAVSNLGALSIQNANDVTAGAITATGITQLDGSGTTRLDGTVTVSTNNISITAATIDVNTNLTTLGASSGLVTLNADGGTLNLDSGGITADGNVSLSATGGITTSADVTTSGDQIDFNDAVVLAADVELQTTNGAPAGANISFDSTLAGAGFDLDVDAGTGGNISFSDDVTNLGDLTIDNANSVIAEAITAASISQFDGSGITQFNDTVTVTTNNVSITSAAIDVNATLDTTGAATGLVTLNADGGSLNLDTNGITADGAVSLTASGGITSSGDITTSGDQIDVNSALTLAADVDLQATNGALTGASINLDSTIAGGGFNLDLDAGSGGNIVFGNSVTNLGTLTIANANNVTVSEFAAEGFIQTDGSGTTQFNDDVSISTDDLSVTTSSIDVNGILSTAGASTGLVTLNADGGTLNLDDSGITADGAVSLTGSTGISSSGDITTSGNQIDLNSAVTLGGDVDFQTTSGAVAGADINFDATVSGASFSVDLDAGVSGDVVLGGALTNIDTLTIDNANNVTASSISAAGFTQISGTGTTQLNGAVTITTNNVSVTTDSIDVNTTISTSGASTGR